MQLITPERRKLILPPSEIARVRRTMPLTPQGPGSHTGLPMTISESSYLSNPTAGVLPAFIVSRAATAVNALANSQDGGVTWTLCTVPAPLGTWQGMAYAPWLGRGFAISSAGSVADSTDGLTWALVPGETLDNSNWREMIACENLGLLVAVALGGVIGLRVSTSPDGVTWTNRATPAAGGAVQWSKVQQNPNTLRIFAGSAQAGLNPSIIQSDDGITWGYSAALPSADSTGNGIAYDSTLDNMYFTGGQNAGAPPNFISDYFTDNNGLSWTQVDGTGTGSQGTCVAINGATGRLIRGAAAVGLYLTGAGVPGPPGNPWVNVAAGANFTSVDDMLYSPEWGTFIGLNNLTPSVIVLSVTGLGGTWSSATPAALAAGGFNRLKSLAFGT